MHHGSVYTPLARSCAPKELRVASTHQLVRYSTLLESWRWGINLFMRVFDGVQWSTHCKATHFHYSFYFRNLFANETNSLN